MMKVAFYGSTNFSLSILKKLSDFHNQGRIQLKYVVSQSSKQLQFSKKVIENPIVKFATETDLKLLTPLKLKNPEFLLEVEAMPVDIAIVAAYGKIVPLSLIKKSTYGFINFHGSILPKYRGAVPVQFSILNQDLENAGITIIKMDAGMDDGDILRKAHVSYSPEEFQSLTAGELMDSLGSLSEQILESDFDSIFNPERWKLEKQSEDQATYCYVADMNKEKMEIKYVDGISLAHGKVMASNPEPKAWLVIEDKKYNVLRSNITSDLGLNKQNSLSFHKFEKKLFLEVSDGFIEVLEIQPEGKKLMDAKSFINGYLR